MRISVFFTAVAGLAFVTTPASAAVANLTTPPALVIVQTVSYEDVLASLRAEGYTIISVETTFLGRMRIIAKSGTHLREVIVSSSTGEVKRDVITQTAGAGATPGTVAAAAAPGQSGTAPGHDPNGPGNSENAPGHSGENPGNSGGNGNGNNGNGNGNGGGDGSNAGGNGKNN